MAQPVRNIIKETHQDINFDKPIRTLLIDGGNLLRISFEDNKVNSKGEHYGGVFQFLLQVKLMLKKTTFDYVYCFFDDEDSGILRFQLYNAYKANRETKKYAEHAFLSAYGERVESKIRKWKEKYAHKKYEATTNSLRSEIDAYKLKKIGKEYLLNKYSEDSVKEIVRIAEKEILDENFARERDILLKYFNELYIRWVFNDKTEGDDLVAYYVANKKPNDLVYIMSTDEDLTQLISDTVCIWNPIKKIAYSTKNFKETHGYPVENVAIKKIFCGDSSDNIGNIKGLSENRLFELMPEMRIRPVTIEEVKERAKKCIDERIAAKKKPLEWHKNIVEGISNKEYDGDFYEINEKIIDLKHPLLTKRAESDIDALMYAPIDPNGRSFENLYEMIKRDGIEDLMDTNSFAYFFVPFKELADREKKKYYEEMSDE
jgi:5'-3' exonuclease